MFRIFLLLIISASLIACSQDSSPSGRSKKHRSSEGSGNFGGKSHKTGSRKPPQMGYTAKREKFNPIAEVKHAFQYVFSSKNKRHKLDNDKRTSSSSYSNTRQAESEKKMNKKFGKGKKVKKAKGAGDGSYGK
jgi:hypothetical protein